MRIKNLKKIDQKKGILFWVTGLAGSGKTSISKILRNKIEKRYGPTVVLSGDDIRNIFNLKSYDYSSRLEIGKKYCKLAKKLTDQNINVIFAVIGMFNELRTWNKKNIKNYVEIFIKANIEKLKKQKKRRLYKYNKNVVGIHIKPQFPNKPNIKVLNNFKESIRDIAGKIFKQIEKKYTFKNEK